MEHQIPKMKRATVDLSRFQVVKGNRGSQRGELLEKFLDRINSTRAAGGFGKISIGRLAKMLGHIPTDQLYPFYKDCERAKTFTAYFFWSLKTEKEKKPSYPQAKK